MRVENWIVPVFHAQLIVGTLMKNYAVKPQGCEVISDSSEFLPVTEAQEYHEETDMDVLTPQCIDEMTSAPETEQSGKRCLR